MSGVWRPARHGISAMACRAGGADHRRDRRQGVPRQQLAL